MRLAVPIALVLLAAGCDPSGGAVRTPAPAGVPVVRSGPADLVVVPRGTARPDVGVPVAFVEVVARRPERQRGLADRDRLEPDHGMLFVYATPAPRRFWMHGCRIALDIAFLRDDGTIAQLETLPPPAASGDAAETALSEPVRRVLEMEAGWFARRSLGPGSRVDVEAAVAGVEAD